MIVVGWLAVVTAVAVAFALVVIVYRTRDAERRLAALAMRLDPGGYPPTDRGLAAAVNRVERASDHLQAATERAAADEQRLHQAIESLPEGVVIADASGQVVFRNKAAASIAGAHHASALVEQAVQAMVRQGLAAQFADQQLELRGPPRKVVRLRAIPVAGRDPTSAGALVVLEDITEKVRLEAARTDFVANLSHELKSPVGAIALLAETLGDEEDLSLIRRLSGRVQLEALRVSRVVDDLLELSRIEHEGVRHEDVAISAIVHEAAARANALAEHRAIALAINAAPGELIVEGDRRQLVSALSNLVDNAVRYSHSGGKVEVWVESHDEFIDIRVRDDGIGIPARDLDRIFERFYRVDRARSRETGGTGLGLAIVRHVAAKHGGSVVVESEEGVGSTFTLRLPLGAQEAI